MNLTVFKCRPDNPVSQHGQPVNIPGKPTAEMAVGVDCRFKNKCDKEN